jgi:hypothetical protein
MRFSMNISGASIASEEFLEFLEGTIRDSGLPPEILCFELTETSAVSNLARANAMMQRLRTLGCSFALDDFGTGLSSLVYLKSLPVSVLKIDGAFVRDAGVNQRTESMVRAIAQLARTMGMETVAEYVETDELRTRMAGLGVDYGQGFAIARPVPFSDAIRDLPTWASVARQRQGGDVELGEEDDTISAALQKELARALLAQGVAPAALEDELQQVIQNLMEDSGTGAEPRRVPIPDTGEAEAASDGDAAAAGHDAAAGRDTDYPRLAAN